MVRGTEVAQMEGEAEQQMGGVEAGKGGRKGRAGEEVRVWREEREAKTEQTESTDCLFSSLLQYCIQYSSYKTC